MTDIIIVKTDNRSNYTGTFPGVGKITIDENGEFESDLEAFEELVSSFPEFYNKEIGKPIVELQGSKESEKTKEPETQDLSGEMDEEEIAELEELAREQAEKEALQKNEINELGKGDDNGSVEEALSAEEKQVYLDSLLTKTRKELEEECKVFPGGEWRSKNKEDLIKYLTEKLG